MNWRCLCLACVVMAVEFCCLVSYAARNDQECLACHLAGSGKSKFEINIDTLRSSVHGRNVSCLSCHPTAATQAHQKSQAVSAAVCGDCHSEVSSHPRRMGQPVSCAVCHGGHNVLPPENPLSTLNPKRIAATCGRCHPEQIGAGSLLKSLWVFRITAHGKADASRPYSRYQCLSCHFKHVAHRESSPPAGVLCTKCHNSSPGSRFLIGAPHPTRWQTASDSATIWTLAYPLFLGCCIVVFFWGWVNRLLFWMSGRSLRRWDKPGRRLVALWWATIGQRRVFRRPSVGFSHYFIFLGVLIPGLIVLALQFDPPVPALAAGFASLFLEIVGLALLGGVVYALRRRFQPLDASPSTGLAGLTVLVILVLIVLTGFLTEGFRISIAPESDIWRHPVGWALAAVLPPSPAAIAIAWYVHFGLVFALLAAMPFSPLRHIFTAPLNLFFHRLGPAGKLVPCCTNSEQPLGITTANDLTWKDLLDTEACVSCGQCRDSCPAYASQKPLNPMKIIQEIGNCALETRRKGSTSRSQELVSQYISEEEIWACTSCHACESSCPVGVEHVNKLMNLRRGLVLEQGKVPPEAIKLLRNIDVYGDPFGYGRASRTIWAKSLEKNFVEGGDKEDFLFWVGCQASFHPRAREVAKAFIALANRAGQRMEILGEQENCCGDPVRRLGQEALFQELVQRNMERFKVQGVKRIVTLCPHCFNTLAHEYPDFGADFRVIHAVEWTASLLQNGLLRPKRQFSKQLTYHDPCYLSRVNRLADFPRAILGLVCDSRLKEMPNTADSTFCCGAGGGRMWLHETGSRINVLRAKQCAETAAEVVSTSCPYCVAMIEDGLGEVSPGPQTVLDVIEIVEMVTR